MKDLDCFLFIDNEIPEDQRRIVVFCVECHNEKFPELGVFYNGSVEGYSNFDWKCSVCNKIIHKAANGDMNEK